MGRKETVKNPSDAVLAAWIAFDKAAREGRNASFSYEAGQGVTSWTAKQPKRLQGRCGAMCRSGQPCRLRVVEGKKRCRLHGGLSTSPKTDEGRAAIAEANRKRKDARERNRELLIERGLEVLAEIERREREGLPLF